MNFIRLVLIASVIPTSIFSWSWFSSPPKPEKVDFQCPYHCGEWGSKSIQDLEWQFVLCLHEANIITSLMQNNKLEDSGFLNRIYPPQFLQKPENYHSEWYQKMLIANPKFYLCFSNNIFYDCYDGWAISWKIDHIDQSNGEHLGKVFERTKYDDCCYFGNGEDSDFSEAEIEKYEKDPDWGTCFWNNVVEKEKYSFTNRIDFQNACLQLEKDLWNDIHDKDFYSFDPRSAVMQQMNGLYETFSKQLQEVRNQHYNIFNECSKTHHAPSAEYELLQKHFENGNYDLALDELKELLQKVKPESLEAHLASSIYTSKGWAENETLLHDEAIASLSHAISINPTNPDAYFDRAIAYFEKGEFDLSLQDFLSQGKDIAMNPDKEDYSYFSMGFMKGGAQGTQEAATEFLPSIYNSACGVGNLLWLTIQHPIDTPKQLINSAKEFCGYLQTCDKAELAEILVPEMYELIVNWDQLPSDRRGELLGYSLGKYGLDILLPVAAIKGLKYVKTYNDIKKAEKLYTLQTLAKSPESKEALTQAATKWKGQREASLSKIHLEIDKHTKHVPGSWNYKEGVGVITHSNPQKLLKDHAGKGQKIKGIPGEPDFRERVDFGEVIGYYVDETTKEKTLTTMGTIRYSKKGAHIVPARPKK